mmetsp:Transcript_7133/g.11257  ORF Transcript_7133/g.11257 Transcript_7133/m.11257 type:complete len:971 (-) Transcript_7133:169-3081(-)
MDPEYDEERDDDPNFALNAAKLLGLEKLQRSLEDEQQADDRVTPRISKTLKQTAGSGPSRKSDVFGADVEDVWASAHGGDELTEFGAESRRGRREGKGRDRQQQPKMNDEIRQLMGEANIMYANQNFAEASRLLMTVIQYAPFAADPYHTLGLIHEEQGNVRMALQFYMIAAALTRNDAAQWKRLGLMSRDLGLKRQAAYCLSKATRMDPNDIDAQWDRAFIYQELHMYSKAALGLEGILRVRPGEAEVLRELAKVYHLAGRTDDGIRVLEHHVSATPTVDLNLANILLELLMSAGHFDRATALVNRLVTQQHSGEVLPLDITVKFGICHAYLGNYNSAEIQFDVLAEHAVDRFADLYFDVAETLSAVDLHDRAYQFYEALQVLPAYATTAVWQKMARCQKAMGNLDISAELYERVLGEDPKDVDASLALSQLYMEMGQSEKALRAIGHSAAAPSTSIIVAPNANSFVDVERNNETALVPVQAGALIPVMRDLTGTAVSNALISFVGKDPTTIADALMLGYIGADEIPPVQYDMTGVNIYEDVRRVVQRGHLFLHAGDYTNFVKTCIPLVTSTLLRYKRGNLSSKPSSKRRRAYEEKAKTTLSGYVWGGLKLFVNKAQSAEGLGSLEDDEGVLQFKTTAPKGASGPKSRLPSEELPRKRRKRKKKKGKALEGEGEDEDEEQEQNHNTGYDLASGMDLAIGTLGCQDYFILVLEVCKALSLLKRYEEALDIVTSAMRTGRLKDEDLFRQFRYFAVGVAYSADDCATAYDCVREMCAERPYSTRLWNLFNRIITRVGEFNAHHKFMVRLLLKHPQSVPLMILVGHHCLMSGFFRLALGEYFRAYPSVPNDPVINLCIGLGYLQQVMSRMTTDRNYFAIQAFTFLHKYFSIRKGSEEACYNLARAYHQIGLLQFAVPYYEKVLSMPHHHDSKDVGKGEVNSLKREAAYNLSLIYRSSGSHALARQILQEYLTI